MMFAVTGIPIKERLGRNETQFGLLTGKYGGRIVFFALMLATAVPIRLIGEATENSHFLGLGLFARTGEHLGVARLRGARLPGRAPAGVA